MNNTKLPAEATMNTGTRENRLESGAPPGPRWGRSPDP